MRARSLPVDETMSESDIEQLVEVGLEEEGGEEVEECHEEEEVQEKAKEEKAEPVAAAKVGVATPR